MRLIFIRHAEPDYSIDSLTEKGWREGYGFVYAEGMRQGGSDM